MCTPLYIYILIVFFLSFVRRAANAPAVALQDNRTTWPISFRPGRRPRCQTGAVHPLGPYRLGRIHRLCRPWRPTKRQVTYRLTIYVGLELCFRRLQTCILFVFRSRTMIHRVFRSIKCFQFRKNNLLIVFRVWTNILLTVYRCTALHSSKL